MTEFDLIQERMRKTQQVMIDNLNQRLYGDDGISNPARREPTIRERISAFMERAKNAWLVLTGKLDPYDHW